MTIGVSIKKIINEKKTDLLKLKINLILKSFCHAFKKFVDIDGEMYAGTIAYFGFFCFFPFTILFVSVISVFIDKDHAAKEVIAYAETYFPLSGKMQFVIFDTLFGVINTRSKASAIAGIMLIWSILQFFNSLISVTNQAWGLKSLSWWKTPLKSLTFLAFIIIMGALISSLPIIERLANDLVNPYYKLKLLSLTIINPYLSFFVIFIILSLFYKLAPRRPTLFKEVWQIALCITFFLKLAELLFIYYLKNIASLNFVYGAFSGIAALLLWFYISGCLFIFGACLCWAASEVVESP